MISLSIERGLQMSSYKVRKTPGSTEWFRHDRFGIFIHWGIYSMAGRQECVKNNEKMPEENYQKYFKYFNPDLYDAKEWARQAKAAGMKYAVMTAKHHDGFCMFDSKFTEYKATNSPAGRDLIKEYVDAFRAEGLRVGLYYSLLDWHHPEFTIDIYHPRNTDDDAEQQNQGRDMKIYAKYMRDQVTELMANYGHIDILWFDYSYSDHVDPKRPWIKGKNKEDWEAEKLIDTARKLQPDIIIDNRTDIEQDLWTPEQYQPSSWVRHPETGEYVTWEACQTFSGSWGYHRDETSWKSPEMLIQMLIKTVSLGGNLLMNVGPTSRGYLDSRAEDALKAYGDWMHYNSRSIYGCTMAEPEFKAPDGCKFTQSEDGRRLYVHLFEYPYASLGLPGLAGKVEYIQFLHDGSEILFEEDSQSHFRQSLSHIDNLLVLTLPVIKPNSLIPVIEIILK